jgi:hypothetical protein
MQQLVEKIAIDFGDGEWELDEEYAQDFVDTVTGYVRKSAASSDKFDPEDAHAEVIWNLWKALGRYGPRPWGNPWYQVLKLKTVGILTNRARKRASLKDKVNFNCGELSTTREGYTYEDCYGELSPLSPFSNQHQIYEYKERLEREYRCKDINTILNLLIENDCKEDNMTSNAVPISECELQCECATKMGKKLQVIGKGQNRVRVKVLATGIEVDLPTHYKVFKLDSGDTVGEFDDEKVTVRAKDIIKDKDKKSAKGSSKKKAKKPDKKPPKKASKSKKKSDKEKGGSRLMKKQTAKQLVLDMLQKKKSCTRTELAEAVISKGLSENTDVKKVKKYVSVILSQLKNKQGLKIVSVEPGKYSIES